MFGLFGKTKPALNPQVTEVVRILSKSYRLTVSDASSLNAIKELVELYGDYFNEYELALKFVISLSHRIQPDNPQAVAEVEKFIKVAKGMYDREFLDTTLLVDELCKVSAERFGINTSDIEAL